jgi:hypothetical protein
MIPQNIKYFLRKVGVFMQIPQIIFLLHSKQLLTAEYKFYLQFFLYFCPHNNITIFEYDITA